MNEDANAWRRVPEDIFTAGNLDAIDELFADDYVEHIAVPPGVPAGRDGLRMFVGEIRNAFPDFRMDILSQYQDGDMHMGHVRSTGTMTGSFMGMPPSGKSAAWDEMHIGRISGGKIHEHWGVVDQLAMMRQLGFVPEPGA